MLDEVFGKLLAKLQIRMAEGESQRILPVAESIENCFGNLRAGSIELMDFSKNFTSKRFGDTSYYFASPLSRSS